MSARKRLVDRAVRADAARLMGSCSTRASKNSALAQHLWLRVTAGLANVGPIRGAALEVGLDLCH